MVTGFAAPWQEPTNETIVPAWVMVSEQTSLKVSEDSVTNSPTRQRPLRSTAADARSHPPAAAVSTSAVANRPRPPRPRRCTLLRSAQQLIEAFGQPCPCAVMTRIPGLVLQLRRIGLEIVELRLAGIVLDVAVPTIDVAHAVEIPADVHVIDHTSLVALDEQVDAVLFGRVVGDVHPVALGNGDAGCGGERGGDGRGEVGEGRVRIGADRHADGAVGDAAAVVELEEY